MSTSMLRYSTPQAQVASQEAPDYSGNQDAGESNQTATQAVDRILQAEDANLAYETALRSRISCIAIAPLFRNVLPERLRRIASAADELSYSPGDTVFLQDDPVRHVLLVTSGRVKITQVNEVGKETLLRVERRGALIDDVTASAQLHSLTARAMDACRLMAWETHVFEYLVENNPIIQRNAIAIMRTRLRTLQDRFCDVSTRPVPQRLARLVVQLAGEPDSSVLTPISFSREELAQMAGTSLFTVSRLLSEWAELQILTVDRKEVVIEDLHRLVQLGEAA